MYLPARRWPPVREDWIDDFHAGTRAALTRCYVEHFDIVSKAVGRVLRGADQETVIQEVFFRLLTDESFRRKFVGGSFRGWLSTVARNLAIDFRRRRNREQPLEHEHGVIDVTGHFSEAAEARIVVERFCKTVLPAKWLRVFETRFLEQLDQREAARVLGISRTTLAYQEHRVRRLLLRFLREDQT